MLKYDQERKVFTFSGSGHLAQNHGFEFHKMRGVYFTRSHFHALKLAKEIDALEFRKPLSNISESQALRPVFDEYEGLYSFQSAGVEYLLAQLAEGRKYLMLADDPGCGKSPTAATVAKCLKAEKVLVICTASLRLNWQRELKKWAGIDAQPFTKGKQKLDFDRSVITSYDLVSHLSEYEPDFIIVDECHALRSVTAKRTKHILGHRNSKGIVDKAPTLFLSGTPIPNGRPNEIYAILKRCAPDVIDNVSFDSFIDKFCTYYIPKGLPFYQKFFTGGKNLNELYVRLRGSGFLLRRKKADVLPYLPPKRFKLIVFDPSGGVKKVMKKEKQFDADLILKSGAPVGASFPEIRKEMGVATAPIMAEYVKTVLMEGVEKIIVFCHHREVAEILEKELAEYNPVSITGKTSASKRQENVDKFQNDPNVRVFIGNEAAEEGITLTAAQDVVLTEPEYVPGKEAQRADRAHRIGQTGAVLVHLPVVEGTLAAKVMARAIDKQGDIDAALDISEINA